MNGEFGDPYTPGDGHGREFRRSVKAMEKKLKRLTDLSSSTGTSPCWPVRSPVPSQKTGTSSS